MNPQEHENPSTSFNSKSEEEPIKWTTEEDLQFFLALGNFKPIGVNKHFQLMVISERLSKALKRYVSPETIWEHLGTFYNLEALEAEEAENEKARRENACSAEVAASNEIDNSQPEMSEHKLDLKDGVKHGTISKKPRRS